MHFMCVVCMCVCKNSSLLKKYMHTYIHPYMPTLSCSVCKDTTHTCTCMDTTYTCTCMDTTYTCASLRKHIQENTYTHIYTCTYI